MESLWDSFAFNEVEGFSRNSLFSVPNDRTEVCILSEAPLTEWEKTYGGTSWDLA
jgi:hypothetical protein